MVDINTAMAAAAAEQKRRSSDGNQERKKRRTGKDMGIEAFDPVTYVAKERADTASMWLVFTFCLLYTSPSPRDMRRSRMPSSA